MSTFFKEAKRLHTLGFAVHWLKPNSKRPIEGAWQKGKRKNWDALTGSHRQGYNMGVRLGEASQFSNGTYLCVVDCDIKSDNPKHRKELQSKLRELIGAHSLTAPCVMSGRGNGSRHIYVRTKKPLSPYRYCQSSEHVKVVMPSIEKVSPREKRELKDHEIKAGVRIRPAWEISVMGEGQQVVVPPSLHPDTGDKYFWRWQNPINSYKDLPLLKLAGSTTTQAKERGSFQGKPFKAVAVDLITSELPDSALELIMSGEGVSDRSVALFTAAIALKRSGFNDNEILSVLTDRDFYLGQVAYEHTDSNDRSRAAQWVKRYTLDKVHREVSARAAFQDEAIVEDLDIDAAQAQTKAIKKAIDAGWRHKLEREGKSEKPKPTLKNVESILKNAVSQELFKFDSFALRASYGTKAPWGAKPGDPFRDVDAALIKHWLAENYRVEPSVQTVWEAMQVIAERNAFHPIREFLRGLPAWDEKPRIAGWLKSHFNASGPSFYLDEVFEKWLVGAITRVFEPGSKFDWMLILEGEQDIGKSSFIEILATPKYFIDKLPDLGDKDAAQALQGIWLVEMGELKELKRNEIETVKGFITRRIDKYRPSYGRATIEAPRQCVFAGSTNAERYLKDDTGNRRFVPARVGRLNFEQLEQDRVQIWAEAFHIYNSGFASTGEMSNRAKEYLKKAHAARMTLDDADIMLERLHDDIEKNGKRAENERFNYKRFRISELFSATSEGSEGALSEFKVNNWNFQLAAKALKKLGATSTNCGHKQFWCL